MSININPTDDQIKTFYFIKIIIDAKENEIDILETPGRER